MLTLLPGRQTPDIATMSHISIFRKAVANRSQTARSEHSLLINKLIKKGVFV